MLMECLASGSQATPSYIYCFIHSHTFHTYTQWACGSASFWCGSGFGSEFPCWCRIWNGTKTLPIHKWILSKVLQMLENLIFLLSFTAMPVHNVVYWYKSLIPIRSAESGCRSGSGKMLRIRPDQDPQYCWRHYIHVHQIDFGKSAKCHICGKSANYFNPQISGFAICGTCSDCSPLRVTKNSLFFPKIKNLEII